MSLWCFHFTPKEKTMRIFPPLMPNITHIQNRIYESLVLFDSVVNSRWFMRSSIVLFLNKFDLFEEKIKRSPLKKHFPEYLGDSDPMRAAKFLLWKFERVNRGHLKLYPQYVFFFCFCPSTTCNYSFSSRNSVKLTICDNHSLTCATDTAKIRYVFVAVKETLLHNALQDSGIL